jgi:hypothetical protein
MKKEIIVALIIGICIGSVMSVVLEKNDVAIEREEHNARMRDVEYYQALTRLDGSIDLEWIHQWSQKEKSEVGLYPIKRKPETE